MKKQIFIISILMSLWGCSESKEHRKNAINIDLTQIEQVKVNQLFKSIDIIPLETSKNCYIGKVSKLKNIDDRIYILDKQQKAIFTFTAEGLFISKLRNVGKGPGEYSAILDFDINPETRDIELTDGRKLLIFDSQNNFKKEFHVANQEVLAINNLMCLDSDKNAFFSYGGSEGIIYSKEKNKIKSKLEFDYPDYYRNIPNIDYPFFSNTNLKLYCKGYPYDIYEVKNTGFELKYKFSFGKLNLNLSETQAKDNDFMQGVIANDKYVFSLFSVYEFKDFLLATLAYGQNPVLLIYQKNKQKYYLAEGEIPKILVSCSASSYLEGNILLVCFTPRILKLVANDVQMFNNEQMKEIRELDDLDNPVIIKMKLNELFLTNYEN